MDRKAEESDYVKRARLRLAKIMAKEGGQVTDRSLEKVKKGIRLWLHRHSDERVKLKDKSIKLFDANKHSAKAKSAYVQQLLSKVAKELSAKKD